MEAKRTLILGIQEETVDISNQEGMFRKSNTDKAYSCQEERREKVLHNLDNEPM